MKIHLIGMLFLVSLGYSQTVEEIKSNRKTYIYGEGTGMTLKRADQEALAGLVSQISTQVESSFTLLKDEVSKSGKKNDYKETFNSVIKSYSTATLKSTERIVLENEPNARVFRYIKRSEISKIFQERKMKILGFVNNAEHAINKKQIADGLRYYYWALSLLKSHPDGSSIEYKDLKGKNHLLASWIINQINVVFAGLSFSIGEIEKSENKKELLLNVFYNNTPVDNFDYSYWTGTDWSNLVSARDGVGVIELFGVAAETKKINLKAEYIFEGQAKIDSELEDVMSKIEPIPIRNSYFTIGLSKTNKKTIKHSNLKVVNKVNKSFSEEKNTGAYEDIMHTVIDAINLREYSKIKQYFSKEGFEIFNKLIHNGKAKVLESGSLTFFKQNNDLVCRGTSMSFDFKTNNKKFIENVVFHFDAKKKIKNVVFGLSKIAFSDIESKNMWSRKERLILIDFLENYKTAYALKRLGYIQKIFSDDALIITGRVTKIKPLDNQRLIKNRIVQYNKQTKEQYLKNLNHLFRSKEYINLRFEQSKIRKAGKGGDIYGIQIKQRYYSSNYGDIGYLFLMIDLNNVDEPVIHVRTWQPQINSNDEVYSLGDFN